MQTHYPFKNDRQDLGERSGQVRSADGQKLRAAEFATRMGLKPGARLESASPGAERIAAE